MHSLINNTRRPDITFHRSGKIDISARIAKTLKIKPGDAIGILLDEVNFYLHIAHCADPSSCRRYEATCYHPTKNGKHLRANSVRLCQAILQQCGNFDRVALPVGPLTTDRSGRLLLPLITRMPI